MTKIAVSKAKKIAMKFFRSEMTPPPFGNFPEIHPFWRRQASLGDEGDEWGDGGNWGEGDNKLSGQDIIFDILVPSAFQKYSIC